MRAAALGHEEVVRVLLDAGADANACRADGFTPLILAVFFGHEAVVRLLVGRGADTGARTSLGTTAVRWAEARGFASMAEILREAEASGPRAVEREKAATTKASDEVEIVSKARVLEEEEEVYSSDVTAARPSASTFRVVDFLRSWQGSLGVMLLLAAFGGAVYALVERNRAPSVTARPTPTPAAQQTPAPLFPTPEPAPAFPTPDPQAVIPVTDQGYPAPNGGGQPYYAPPVPSDVPRELTVVSECDAPATQDVGLSGRRANANDSAPARNDNASAAAPRARRTPVPEPPRQAAPAPSPSQPPPPAPQSTPRAKVIQWPPQ
jgi:hypothetical protein